MGLLACKIMRYEDIEGYEGIYGVTEAGGVFAYTRLRISSKGKVGIVWQHVIRQSTGRGYKKVSLYKDGQRKTFFVHRLVAKAFLSNPEDLPMVNHKDFNKANNNVSNLEFVTARGNSLYSSMAAVHSSQYVGVTWCKSRNKWQAQYQVGRKKVFLGRYVTEIEAHEAYSNAIKMF